MRKVISRVGIFLREEIAGVFAAAKAARTRLGITLAVGAAASFAIAAIFDADWANAGEAPFGESAKACGDFLYKWSKPQYIPLAMGVMLLAAGYAFKIARWRTAAFAAIIAMPVAGFFFASIPKGIVGRARPELREPSKFVGPTGDAKTQSFPSGHTAHTTAFSATILLLAPEVGLPAMALPAVTGWGRLANHAHYPSDVVAGATLGALGAIIAAERVRRRQKPKS